MGVIEAIQQRRSIRHYRSDEIPEEILNRLLGVLRLAPSGGNRQPWKFVVVRDKETRGKLAAACCFSTEKGHLVVQDWIAEAPVVIVACGAEKEGAAGFYREDGVPLIANGQVVIGEMGKRPGEYVTSVPWDLAIALDHFSLAAVEEGLGTCWIAGVNEKVVKNLLSIPDDIRAQLIMPVGYSALSWPDPRPRKSLEEIVCYDKYS